MNVKGDFAEDYCKLVMDVISGTPVELSWFVDGWKFNSCGGRDVGSTMFAEFWKECRQILHPTCVI